MSDEGIFAISFLLCAAVALSGLKFMTGPVKGYLDGYRDPGQWTYVRNLPFAAPIAGALMLPVLALGVLGTGGYIDGIHVSHQLQGAVIFFVAGYFFITVAVVDFLLYRPPRWLIPRWLRKDDERIGFVPPEPNWFDKLVLLCGIPFLLVGLGGFGASLAYLLGVLK